MGYVIYNTATTAKIGRAYRTESAAKAAVTRGVNGGVFARDDVAVTDTTNYYATIEGTHEVVNMMTGKTVRESVNTPHCCSVASETYWSM